MAASLDGHGNILQKSGEMNAVKYSNGKKIIYSYMICFYPLKVNNNDNANQQAADIQYS